MLWQVPLSQEQVDTIWRILSEEQQGWINEYTNQRKRDKWLEILAIKKGIVLDDHMSEYEKRIAVNDWELLEILDGGEGNRPYKCECGKSLRYQYKVYHHAEGKTYHLGSTCIEHYTGLSADVVRDIKNGIFHIKTERDELLLKIWNKEFTDLSKYQERGAEVSDFILQQVGAGIPLLDSQITKLENSLQALVRQKQLEERERQRQERLKREVESFNSRESKEEQNDGAAASHEKSAYTYESFIDENLHILKKIREKEERLSPKLRDEWLWMQNEVRHLKREGTMDFDTFLIRMKNMMIPLRIDE